MNKLAISPTISSIARAGSVSGTGKTRSNVSRLAEASIIAANQAFYDRIAEIYDGYESYVFDTYWQQNLEKDIDTIQSLLAQLQRTPHCLDCGAGTGNLTLKLLERGWEVTVVDVSSEMLSRLHERAKTRKFAPTLVHNSIECFLEEARDAYDLVAFSSVLHHTYSYTSTVQQSAALVRPGGIFYSVNDPVVPKRARWTRAGDNVDIAIAKMMFDPADFLPGIWRRLRKHFAPAEALYGRPVITPGDLAEYHARTGVDDASLLRLLEENGLAIIEHRRYPAGRTPVVRFCNRKVRLLEHFKIIARRTSGFLPGDEDG